MLIESSVIVLGLALRHVADDVVPHSFGRELSGLNPCNRLDVNRDAFLDPVMFPRHRRKGQVDHLVSQHPIVVQLGNRCVCPQRDADVTAAFGIGDSTVDAGTSTDSHVETEVRDRELAVVGADRIPGAMDPVHQVSREWPCWSRRQKLHVDRRTADVDRRRRSLHLARERTRAS